MSPKAAEAPLSESARIFQARRQQGLEEAKQRKAASTSLFGDISVTLVPPPPEKEEPPPDEPLSEEDREIERAFQESAGLPTASDVEAIAIMAGAYEPSAAEALASSEAALAEAEDAEAAAYGAALLEREEAAILRPEGCTCRPSEGYGGAMVIFGCPVHDVLGREIDVEVEPLGPDSFGGSDEESHYMSQTSAARLRYELAGSGAGEFASRAVDAAESSPESAGGVEAPGAEASEAVPPSAAPSEEEPGASSRPEGFALFGENLFGESVKPKTFGPLSERFKWPPFTIFDARQGPWQDRKRAWIGLGIQSEVGRAENLLGRSPQDVFSQESGLRYKEAREIYAKELAEQGDAFDLQATILKYRGTSKKSRGGGRAFGQDFVLGAQPGVDGKAGGQGKAWHTNDTGLSRKLAPGGGGGGAWLGGPKTSSSDKFGRDGEADVVTDENGNPLSAKTGTSIFDPVLTELLYSWFAPPAGMILDPFAGGSVRGIVAAKLQRIYVGIELRPEQIAANESQADRICSGDDCKPIWIEGDSANAKELTDGGAFDFLMACPPYGDLEQYSEDPRDLSNMTWEEFSEAYTRIIAAGVELLKPDRFACFVIGDIRDEGGFYRGLPELTVRAFEQAGARKYNEAILVTSIGSLPIRIGKQFNSGRKLGKTHQNVLVFIKGDPRRAAEACGGQLDFTL